MEGRYLKTCCIYPSTKSFSMNSLICPCPFFCLDGPSPFPDPFSIFLLSAFIRADTQRVQTTPKDAPVFTASHLIWLQGLLSKWSMRKPYHFVNFFFITAAIRSGFNITSSMKTFLTSLLLFLDYIRLCNCFKTMYHSASSLTHVSLPINPKMPSH